MLHKPLLFQLNDFDVVKALVVFDADVNRLNYTNLSPMDHADFMHRNEVCMHNTEETEVDLPP